MTAGERVRAIRKSSKINLTMEKFGDALGVGKTAISKIENDERGLTDQMVLAICRTFDVDEHWIRTGEGEMFVQRSHNEQLTSLVNEMLADRDETFRKQLVTAILQLSEAQLATVRDFCLKLVKDQEAGADPAGGLDVEAELAEYKNQLEKEKNQEGSSSRSLA